MSRILASYGSHRAPLRLIAAHQASVSGCSQTTSAQSSFIKRWVSRSTKALARLLSLGELNCKRFAMFTT